MSIYSELLRIISISCGSDKKTAAFVPKYPPPTVPYNSKYLRPFWNRNSGVSLRNINDWPKIGIDGGPKKKKIIIEQYRKINSDRDYKCGHIVELEN